MVNQLPDGKVMHATLAFGDSTVFLCDEFSEGCSRSPETLGGTPVVIHLEVDDCGAWFERAVAAGCTVTMPLQDQFWGDRYGAVADPYGPPWEWRGPTGTAEGSATLIANMAGRGVRSARSPVARSAVCLLQEHPAG